MMKKVLAAGSIVAASASAALADVTAPTIDYTTAASGISTQIGTALTAALPIMGIVLGIYAGVKMFKRFAK